MYRLGYDGGEGISTANQELIVNNKGWTVYSMYEFSFLNDKKCTVKINGSNPIPCPVDVGFQINENDAPITSFVIVESGIGWTWRGKY